MKTFRDWGLEITEALEARGFRRTTDSCSINWVRTSCGAHVVVRIDYYRMVDGKKVLLRSEYHQ